MEIGIISIMVAVIIAFIPFLRSRYFLGPELTIEIIREWWYEFSNRIKFQEQSTDEGYIDGNTGIRIFELTWRFKLIIRNNSDNTAYYPKIHFVQSKQKFTA